MRIFLQERIFGPLGMGSTRIISEEDIIPHRAAGYRLVARQRKNQEWVSPTFNSTADGALYFTILDLQKRDAALYTEKLLKRSSLGRCGPSHSSITVSRTGRTTGWGGSFEK